MGLFVRIDKHDDVWLLQLEGVLNFETRVDLRRACHRLLTLPAPQLVMDIERVTVLDRPGLDMLIRLRREARAVEGCLVLTRIPPRLVSPFAMAGVIEGFVADVYAPTPIRAVVDTCLAAEIAQQVSTPLDRDHFMGSVPSTSGSWGSTTRGL